MAKETNHDHQQRRKFSIWRFVFKAILQTALFVIRAIGIFGDED